MWYLTDTRFFFWATKRWWGTLAAAGCTWSITLILKSYVGRQRGGQQSKSEGSRWGSYICGAHWPPCIQHTLCTISRHRHLCHKPSRRITYRLWQHIWWAFLGPDRPPDLSTTPFRYRSEAIPFAPVSRSEEAGTLPIPLKLTPAFYCADMQTYNELCKLSTMDHADIFWTYQPIQVVCTLFVCIWINTHNMKELEQYSVCCGDL